MDILWLPEVYIYHAKSVKTINSIYDHKSLIYHFNDFNGNIQFELTALDVVLNCPMNFDAFPFDSQICYFKLGSWKTIEISHQNFSLQYLPKAEMSINSEYDAKIIQLSESEYFHPYLDNYFQYTGFEVHLSRKSEKYFTFYYIPSGFLVTLSWVRICIMMYSYRVQSFTSLDRFLYLAVQ